MSKSRVSLGLEDLPHFECADSCHVKDSPQPRGPPLKGRANECYTLNSHFERKEFRHLFLSRVGSCSPVFVFPGSSNYAHPSCPVTSGKTDCESVRYRSPNQQSSSHSELSVGASLHFYHGGFLPAAKPCRRIQSNGSETRRG